MLSHHRVLAYRATRDHLLAPTRSCSDLVRFSSIDARHPLAHSGPATPTTGSRPPPCVYVRRLPSGSLQYQAPRDHTSKFEGCHQLRAVKWLESLPQARESTRVWCLPFGTQRLSARGGGVSSILYHQL